MVQTLRQSQHMEVSLLVDPFEILKAFCLTFKNDSKLLKQCNQQITQLLAKTLQQEQLIFVLQAQIKESKEILQQKHKEIESMRQEHDIKMKEATQSIENFKKMNQECMVEVIKLRSTIQDISNQMSCQHRQKVHEIVINHKNQMILYRKSQQENAWRTEFMLRAQIDTKNQEIKRLIATIDRIKNSHKLNSKEWILLQNLMKPYGDHALLIQKISQLRKQICHAKSHALTLNTKLLELEMMRVQQQRQKSKIEDQLKSMKQHHQVLSLLNNQKTALLEKQIKDKDSLAKYYDDKWIQQFNQVKGNLEKKYQQRKELLEKNHQHYKMQLESQLINQKTQNQTLKQQIDHLTQDLEKAQKTAEEETNVKNGLMITINQLKNIIRETNNMSREDLQAHLRQKQLIINDLNQRVKDLSINIWGEKQSTQSKLLIQEQEHKKRIDKFEEAKKKQIKSYQDIIFRLQQEKSDLMIIAQETELKRKESQRLAKVQFDHALERRLEQQKNVHDKQLHLHLANYEEKEHSLNCKIREGQLKFKRLLAQIEDLRRQLLQQQSLIKKSSIQNGSALLQSKNKLKNAQEINRVLQKQKDKWKQQCLNLQITIKSLNILVQSKEGQIKALNSEIKDSVRQQNKWTQLLRQTQKQFKDGFQEIRESCDKALDFYKSRVWQLEGILEMHPTSHQDNLRIQSLSEKCRNLQNKLETKEAEKIILNQVKQYYETKVTEGEFKTGIEYHLKNKSVLVKRPRRRQGLLSLKQTINQKSSAIFDTRDAAQLQRYIKSRKKQTASFSTDKERKQRNNSCMI